LNLKNKYLSKNKKGQYAIYKTIEKAVDDLGSTIVLDCINQCLRNKAVNNIDIFKLDETSQAELLQLQYDAIQKEISGRISTNVEKSIEDLFSV